MRAFGSNYWGVAVALATFVAMLFLGCDRTKEAMGAFYRSNDAVFYYLGRHLVDDDHATLIGPASGVEFKVLGDTLELYLKSENDTHNYFSLSIDGEYQARYRIGSDSMDTIAIALQGLGEKYHDIGIYKATEASNGAVLFFGAKSREIEVTTVKRSHKIEFIGNSITCGMGADLSSVSCGEGEWFDQHNAYLAFGPRTARALHSEFMLSSVSGIGMYRNWNDEHLEEPIMPEVYDNLYLDRDTLNRYSFDFNPEIICICLGTNDLSDGDGTKARLPFNQAKFVSNYIAFTEHLYEKNPDAKLVLMNSPMVSGDKGQILLQCLQEVKLHYRDDPKVSVFQFRGMQPNGCTSHPDIEDHQLMSDQLKPFLNTLIK